MSFFLSARARPVRSLVVLFALTGMLVSGLSPAPIPGAAAQTDTSSNETPADNHPSTREELTELRTRNAKFYQEPDGTRTAELYAEPIHFETDSGRWLEIDTSLVASDRPGYAYENRRGAFAVEFSATAKESGMVRVQSEGAVLSFGVAGADRSSRAVVSANRLTYPGVLPGVDLALEVTPEGLKEFVVLTKRPDKPLSVRFPFSLQGVRPKKQADGRISFLGDDGKSAFALPRGWMFDSSGSEHMEPAVSEAVDIDLDLKSRQPAITLTPDSRWLADPARVYPIMVDPTVETLNPSADCFITNGSNADTTHCSDAALRVGWDTSMKRRGLLKFPVEQLPDGSYVTDADLKLYLTDSSTIQSAPIEVHRLTSSWGGGVTWKRRTWDNQNLWGTAGGDFTSFVWATRGVSGTTAGYKAWDVTSLVREWRKPDGSPNYGMILKQDTESVNNLLKFATNQSPESQWPKLVVHYGSVTMDVAEWNADTTTGTVSYNFSVSATGLNHAGDPAGPCYNTNCTWQVQTRYSDGTEEVSWGTLDSGLLESNPASFTKTFTGTLSNEVTHIRAQVLSARCSCFASHAWYDYDSGWIKVSDPYPNGSVSLAIGNWSRDATTNQVEYDLTVSGGGAGQFGGPCAENSCRWSVDVRYEDGSTFELGSGDLDRGTWSFTESLNGATTFPKKVTDLRAVLRSKCSLGGGYWCWHRHETYTTDWLPVSDFMLDEIDVDHLAAVLATTSLDELCVEVEERARVLRIPDATPSTTTHAATEACFSAPSTRAALIAIGGVVGGAAVIGAIIHHYAGDDPNADSIRKVPRPETDTAGAGVRPPTSCLTEEQKASILEELRNKNSIQDHHVATNKSQYWKPLFEELLARAENDYANGKSLNGDWNVIENMEQAGNHPPAYHYWVFRNMEKALREVDYVGRVRRHVHGVGGRCR